MADESRTAGERIFRKFVLLLLVVAMVAIARVNLPPNDIKNNTALKDGVGFFEELLYRAIASETVADWTYTDLGLVKFAHSR